MHAHPSPTLIPIERYRTLIGLLNSDKDAWDDTFWLRFAAQVAVLAPVPPVEVTQRIRQVADTLLKHASWYHTLASPARFVIASMLVQHHIPVADFISEHAHIASLMSSVGLRHERFYEVVTVLILMMSPGHHSSTTPEIKRLKAIYDAMKAFHWWLTGPDDLPACAALAQCEGSPAELVNQVEAAFQQLHAVGIPVDEHLQTVANILPLAGPDTDNTVLRYFGLTDALLERKGSLSGPYYEPLALLTLLDHHPEVVIERLTAANDELDLFQPESAGEANILIASDLAFLDLMRFERDQTPLQKPSDMAQMLRLLHSFHLASAVLVSQIDPQRVTSLDANGVRGWPYPYLFV